MTDSTAKNASTSTDVRSSTLLRLAWPIVLARATQAVAGFTDARMVAPLGKEALAATTTGGLNAFAFIILPMGTAFIVQSFTSQHRAKGPRAHVQECFDSAAVGRRRRGHCPTGAVTRPA